VYWGSSSSCRACLPSPFPSPSPAFCHHTHTHRHQLGTVTIPVTLTSTPLLGLADCHLHMLPHLTVSIKTNNSSVNNKSLNRIEVIYCLRV
jgi:hypothetical protein